MLHVERKLLVRLDFTYLRLPEGWHRVNVPDPGKVYMSHCMYGTVTLYTVYILTVFSPFQGGYLVKYDIIKTKK